jgi:hypothetical protein
MLVPLLDAEGEEREDHRGTNQMTVQTAPKQGGARNAENKLVEVIHDVVAPLSCFRHGRAALGNLWKSDAG